MLNIEPKAVHVDVSVAVLINANHQVLLGQRPPPKPWEGWWEFPGGKVKNNETFEEALNREIQEELNIKIKIHEKITEEKYKDEKIHILLHYYLCSLESGTMSLNEHEAFAWIEKKDFDKYDFAEGDGNMLSLL